MAIYEWNKKDKVGEIKMDFLTNKKGINTDVLVIILLIIGLAIAVIVFISFGASSQASGEGLFNLVNPLKDASGI